MAITEDDKKFITSRLVFALAGFFVAILAGTLIRDYVLSRAFVPKVAQAPGPAHAVAAGLDTPVVLVGGSLNFKARDTGLVWVQDSDNDTLAAFHVSPQYAVASIVVKKRKDPGGNDPDPDDTNASTDKLRVTIPDGASWEVDEFIPGAPGNPDVMVASIKPDPVTSYQLDLTAAVKGKYLCPSGPKANPLKSIAYSLTLPCPAPSDSPPPPDGVTFSSISIKVTIGGQTQTWGTLNCLDANGDPVGKCRIVFRGD